MSAGSKEEQVYRFVVRFMDSLEGRSVDTDSLAEKAYDDLYGHLTQAEWDAIPSAHWDAHYRMVADFQRRVEFPCGCCDNPFAEYMRHGA